jgi:hypothetical protein
MKPPLDSAPGLMSLRSPPVVEGGAPAQLARPYQASRCASHEEAVSGTGSRLGVAAVYSSPRVRDLSMRSPPAPPRTRLRHGTIEPRNLELALAVQARLLDKPGAEFDERGDERVDLVQRVLDVELGVELELEADPLRAVRDLEDDPRLRVDVPAALVAEQVTPRDLAVGTRSATCAIFRRLARWRSST